MATNKKPRKKYRPKGLIMDPMAFIKEGMAAVTTHDNYLVDLKIRNHGAMAALMRGQATKDDVTVLMAMNNMVEALFRLGFGTDYEDVMTKGFNAIVSVASRGEASGRFTLYAHEIAALNDHMELHDAQMEVITVRDIERGIDLIKREKAAGKMTRIINK